MPEIIEVEDHGAVRVVAINRPELRNAINTAVLIGLRRAIREAAKTEALRTLVLTGRGGAFSAGADVKEWADKNRGIDPHPDHDWVEEACQLVLDVFRFPKPTVAMIDGAAVGAGLDMALACDFRYASARAKFICAYTRIGYPPDCGGSWLLPRLIGPSRALRLLYSGDFLEAAEAKAIGYANEVVAPEALMDAARAEARRYLKSSPFSIRHMKELVWRGLERDVAGHMARHVEALQACFKSEDHKEGVASFLERRPAQFVGR